MNDNKQAITIEVEPTEGHCALGERLANQNIADEKIPVFSCEGACIKGEIARLAANLLAKEAGYARGCHGELLTMPDSSMAKWVKTASKIILIDGCFLSCFHRMLKNLVGQDKLIQFDALNLHQKYSELFSIDAISQPERNAAVQAVLEKIKTSIRD